MSKNPSLRMMLEQQEFLRQEIVELLFLADTFNNSIVKYAGCQEELHKKRLQLLDVENHITRTLFASLNKTAANYPKLEE